MKRAAWALSILFCAAVSVRAEGGLLKCINDEDGQVSNKTKLLKTYTREYWQIALQEIKSLPEPLRKTGFVAGDFHFNNAGIFYDYTRSRAEFQIADLDDAGKNFLIVDFFKFLSFIQKLDKSVDQRLLFNAYVDGLNNKEAAPPSEIESLLYRSQLDYSKDSRKYFENQREEITAFDKSSVKKSENEVIQKLSRLKLISRLENLDYMIQVNDSGSSMNALRVIFIGTDPNGVTGVIEFKQMKCAATGPADFQNVQANFEAAKKFVTSFSPGSIVKDQFVHRLDDDHYFLVREKKKNFIKKVDLEGLPPARLAAVASYYANYLGRLHSASAGGSYSENVKSHAGELIEMARSISKKFKDEVKN